MVEEDDNNKVSTTIKLNFRCIYEVNFNHEDTKALKNITNEFNNLPKFKEDTLGNSNEGFMDFTDDFKIEPFIVRPCVDPKDSSETTKLRYEKKISNKDILSKRFRYATYTEGRNEPNYVEADIFWIKPCDVLLIKGGKSACDKITDYLIRFNNVGFTEIKFDHDFLLWILYRYDQYNGVMSSSTTADIIIEKIDKGRTHGEDTNENDIEFKDGQSRLMPFTTLYGLLINHEILHIGGDFQFRKKDHKINAKLAKDITMHIYADHVLKGKSYGEKCALAFPFIIEMMEIFENWTKMPAKSKYPDDKFFDSAKESFETQMHYSLEGIKELKKKYKKLRKGCSHGS
jgi:hypothetical protein